jgi:hypothetical protein
MPRYSLLLAVLAFFTLVSSVEASPFGKRGQYSLPPAKYPRLAAYAQPDSFGIPGYVHPEADSSVTARYGPDAVWVATTALSFSPSPLAVIGTGISLSLRVAHVSMNGVPYPGRPVRNAIWIASPFVLEVGDRIKDRQPLFRYWFRPMPERYRRQSEYVNQPTIIYTESATPGTIIYSEPIPQSPTIIYTTP